MGEKIVRIPETVWNSSLWAKKCQVHPEVPASTLIQTSTFLGTPVYEKFYCEYCYSKWRALEIETSVTLRRSSIRTASEKYRSSKKGSVARKEYYARNKDEINKRRREKYRLSKKEKLDASKDTEV